MEIEVRARRIGNSLGIIIPRKLFPLAENEPLALRRSGTGVLEIVRQQVHDYEAVVRDFLDSVGPRLGRGVQALVLYGSVARGNPRQEILDPSDVDLFALVETRAMGAALDATAFEVSSRHGYIPVSVLSWTPGRFKREARSRNPLIDEMRRGRVLYGSL